MYNPCGAGASRGHSYRSVPFADGGPAKRMKINAILSATLSSCVARSRPSEVAQPAGVSASVGRHPADVNRDR